MRKVIVGYNAREESRDALLLGKSLAASEGAELHVAVVLPRGSAPLEQALTRVPISEQLDEELFEDVARELGDTGFTPVHLDGEIAGRSAARALFEYARDQEAGLIVVGSSHRGALGRVMAGSVGESLLRGAPCAVAVAPRGYATGEAKPVETVTIGFDGSRESKRALAEGEQLARELGARLRVTTVIPPFAPLAIQGLQVEQIQDVLREHYKTVLDEAVAGLDPGLGSEAVLAEGDPARALTDRSGESDLLVLGSRGYGPIRSALLGAVSTEVVRSAPCPVLVVPRGADG